MEQKEALILGATGLVGGHLLHLLLEDYSYSSVTALVRRPLGQSHDKLKEKIVDFDALEDSGDAFKAHHIFCCLGTTMKQAGSKDAFRKVDHDYVVRAGKLAKAGNAEKFLVVTALGAKKSSGVFYNRVKGEVEEDLASLGIPALHIFRPSLLLGMRQETRFLEGLGASLFRGVAFLMKGPLKKVAPIEGALVAKAMVHNAKMSDVRGTLVHPSGEMQGLSK